MNKQGSRLEQKQKGITITVNKQGREVEQEGMLTAESRTAEQPLSHLQAVIILILRSFRVPFVADQSDLEKLSGQSHLQALNSLILSADSPETRAQNKGRGNSCTRARPIAQDTLHEYTTRRSLASSAVQKQS